MEEEGFEDMCFDNVGELHGHKPEEFIPHEIQCIRALLSAILERAILDYKGSDRAAYAAAAEWIIDPYYTTDDYWSFPWVCMTIGFCPLKTRVKILALERKFQCL